MFIGRAGAFAALVALLGSLALAAPAGATTSTKPYAVTVSPGTTTYETQSGVLAGGEAVQVTATITDPASSSQQMGSADISAPSGFALLNSSQYPLQTTRGTVSLSSSCSYTYPNAPNGSPCVALRNLSMAAGQSVTVTMWVVTPACEQGNNFAFYVEAHQANNYISGGNVFTNPPTGNLNVTLDGACSLAFVNQPADAKTGQAISDQAFNPPPLGGTGDPVTVEVLDSTGNQLTTSSAPVSMGLNKNPGAATLGGTTTEAASGGTASFADLTLNASGDPYELAASSGTLTGANSTDFSIQDQFQSCSSGTCTTNDGNSNGNGQVQGTVNSPGILTESLNANNNAPLACAGYTTADPNNYEFNAPSDWSKVITITIVPTTNLGTNPKQILKSQQICFEAPYPFTTNSGAPATSTTFPDGTPGFIGLLPDCAGNVSGPCHDRKSDTTIPNKHSKTGYNIILVADVPAGEPGDPRFG